MKFAKWVNPKNNEIRVYINGAGGYGVSVYAKDSGINGNPEIIVRAKDGRLIGQPEIDLIMDEVDRFVDEKRPDQPSPWVAPKFADYLAIAS